MRPTERSPHAGTADDSGDTAPLKLSPLQEQLLRGLAGNGGVCAYGQIARVTYGMRKQDLPSAERSRIAVTLRHLETRGLVTLTRRWGTLGYGQPEMIVLTDLGRTYSAEISQN